MFYVNARAIVQKEQDGQVFVLLQTRNKPGEGQHLELPGGRLETFESFLDALKREVQEETGLSVNHIVGGDTRILAESKTGVVECLAPFAVYQTVQGPVDSVGAYFLCSAEGELLDNGDETEKPRWVEVTELKRLIEEQPQEFSWVDLAGLRFYCQHKLA